MVEIVGALADARVCLQVEREQMLGGAPRPGLGERTQGSLGVIVEAPHSLVGAVVVVEGPVLLHEEDDVLDGAEV